MSDNEIRIAIAEKCGLEKCGKHSHTNSLVGFPIGAESIDDWEVLPDYPNDLNACHEFWLQFSLEEKVGYAEHLHFVVARDYNATQAETGAFSVLYKMVQCALMVGATDHQRCEAFLRAHGLWKDNPTPERSESK